MTPASSFISQSMNGTVIGGQGNPNIYMKEQSVYASSYNPASTFVGGRVIGGRQGNAYIHSKEQSVYASSYNPASTFVGGHMDFVI